jgi:hypothetical protein
MAQARREPRFSEIEVLPPTQAGRAAGLDAFDANDVSDAVFETLPAQIQNKAARKSSPGIHPDPSFPGLGLLKQNMGPHAERGSEQAGLTPGFAAFTILAAFSVFWLCGGHALLY